MEIHNEALTELVENLIRTGREDDWWDFKECHHEDRAALLHDIICLANNHADRDSYLIFGVRDKTFEIIGVESDPHRKNQQNIVDFLSQKAIRWASTPSCRSAHHSAGRSRIRCVYHKKLNRCSLLSH